MGIEIRIFMMISIMLCLRSAVHAAQGNAVYHPPPHKPYAAQGNAVYYDPPYTKSACYQNQDHGTMVTGVSDDLWDGGRACGRRQPCNGVLNLSKDAFAVIADTVAGKVQVEYNPV
ncbi:hypothetical protein AB3S75_018412 [Citrus x aurantiifolia]